jgi:Ca-activated chloride channel family protein
MTFVTPSALVVALLALPLAVWLLVHRERRRRAALDRFGEARLLEVASALPEPGRRFIRPALLLGALGLGLVALARPELGVRSSLSSGSGHDLLFLLDLSRSMDATDVAPSRLDAAKRAASLIAAAAPDDRLGLAVFGGNAFLTLPLTLDHSAFQAFLDGAATIDLPDAGTDLGGALSTAVQTLERDGGAGARAIVLLSDGEDLEGGMDSVLPRLSRAGVPVFVIGVGTTAGGTIPVRLNGQEAGPYRDAHGVIVTTRLDDRTLRSVAQASKGDYVEWTGDGAARQIAADLARLASRHLAGRVTAPLPERFQWPLALAILALALESVVPDHRPRRRS